MAREADFDVVRVKSEKSSSGVALARADLDVEGRSLRVYGLIGREHSTFEEVVSICDWAVLALERRLRRQGNSIEVCTCDIGATAFEQRPSFQTPLRPESVRVSTTNGHEARRQTSGGELRCCGRREPVGGVWTSTIEAFWCGLSVRRNTSLRIW